MDSIGDVTTSLGGNSYIPSSDVSAMMGHSQQQQMLNHHQNLTASGNDSGGVMGMNGMQHLNSNSLNIKSDYGLTAL